MIVETKTMRVYNWLRAYIDEQKFSAKDKIPSENMLCRKLDVSRDTVRKAIRMLEEEALVIRARGSGTYINKGEAISNELNKSGTKKRVGLILQGQDKDANAELIRGVRDVLDSAEIEIRVLYTDNMFSNERKCLNVVSHQDYDGLIIDGVKASILNPNLDCYYNLKQQNIPVVFYNNYYKDLQFPRVIHNDKKAAQELILRLVKAGHKHIAGIFVYDNYQSTEKFQGYVQALIRYGAEFEDDYVKWCISNEAHTNSFVKEISKFIKGIPKCTAIVCCNYMILRLVLQALEKDKKRIPEDYSVVCFDYSGKDWEAEGITCSLANGYETGIKAGMQLYKMLSGVKNPNKIETLVIDAQIYDGSSVGAVRKMKQKEERN